MKLTLIYEGNKQGFNLEQDLEADIVNDAEALGYITNVLFETTKTMSEFLYTTNPKYHERISKGIARSMLEKQTENNPIYPFTKMIINDE